MIEQARSYMAAVNTQKLELLRRRINDEGYLHAAIQRLALVMSNELMGLTMEGRQNERQRKRRK